MSRKSKEEYIAEKRRVYVEAGRSKRSGILTEVCETVEYTRKYVIKLLTGNIRYKERKGRGKTYSERVLANARRLWDAVGCPCTTYFIAELPRIVREYEEMHRTNKASRGRGCDTCDERIDSGPCIQGTAENQAVHRKGQQALWAQQAHTRCHRMQIRRRSHGLQC